MELIRAETSLIAIEDSQKRQISAYTEIVTTVTQTFKSGVDISTRTLAIENPLPTVVYHCQQMDVVCSGTAVEISRQPQGSGQQLQLTFDPLTDDRDKRREQACSSTFTNVCGERNKCDTRLESARDWATTCDEAAPASCLEGGLGATVMCASFTQQGRQASILRALGRTKSSERSEMFNDKAVNKLHRFVLSLDYGNHPVTQYGRIISGGTNSASTKIVSGAKLLPGRSSTSGAFSHTSTSWGYGQTAVCTTGSSCTRPTTNLIAKDYPYAVRSQVTSLPDAHGRRNKGLAARATTSSCSTTSKKSDKDRSKDKARNARRLADLAKDLIDRLDEEADLIQDVKDAAEIAVAAVAAAAAAASAITDDDDGTSSLPQEVYDSAERAIQEAHTFEDYDSDNSDLDDDVQDLYQEIIEAAAEASSAVDIASSYLTFTTSKSTTASTPTMTSKPTKTTTATPTSTSTSSSKPTQTSSPPKGGCYGEGAKARLYLPSIKKWLGYSSTGNNDVLDRYSLLHLHESGDGRDYLSGIISPGHPFGLRQKQCAGVEGLFEIDNDNQNNVWNPYCAGDSELRGYFNKRRTHTLLVTRKDVPQFSLLYFVWGDRNSQIDALYDCLGYDRSIMKITPSELIFDTDHQTQTDARVASVEMSANSTDLVMMVSSLDF